MTSFQPAPGVKIDFTSGLLLTGGAAGKSHALRLIEQQIVQHPHTMVLRTQLCRFKPGWLERELDGRLAATPQSFKPGNGWPFILLIFHDTETDSARLQAKLRCLARLAKEGRGAGIAVVAAAQDSAVGFLKPIFGQHIYFEAGQGQGRRKHDRDASRAVQSSGRLVQRSAS